MLTRLLLLVTVLGLLASGTIAIAILRPNWVNGWQHSLEKPFGTKIDQSK